MVGGEQHVLAVVAGRGRRGGAAMGGAREAAHLRPCQDGRPGHAGGRAQGDQHPEARRP